MLENLSKNQKKSIKKFVAVIGSFVAVTGFIASIMTIFDLDIPDIFDQNENEDYWRSIINNIDSKIENASDSFNNGDYLGAIDLSNIAIELYTNATEQDKILELQLSRQFYEMYRIFGDAHLALSRNENIEHNLNEAIYAYNIIIKQIPNNNSVEYALTHKKMGDAYLELSKIRNRKSYLNLSIRAYNRAIESEVFETKSNEYAQIQNRLGVAYCLLSGVEDKAENLNKSINYHENALLIYEKNDSSLEYAETRNYLGVAYAHMAEVRNEEYNLNQSMVNHSIALRVRQLDDDYDDDSQSQNNIGNVYRSLSNFYGDEDHLRSAINLYNISLRNSTNELEKADIMNNLGMAYCDLSEYQYRMKNLNISNDYYESSLAIRTKNEYPIYFANTADSLSVTYVSISESVQNKDEKINYLSKAFANLSESSQIRENESEIDYAITLHNIGVAYLKKFSIMRNQNDLEEAVKYFESSIKIKTKNEYPLDYALTKYCMGDAYYRLSDFKDEDANKGKAEDCYIEAFDIYEAEKNQYMSNKVRSSLAIVNPRWTLSV